MKYIVATLAIAGLVAGGSTIAAGAQAEQRAGDDPQRPRVEQRGPQGRAQLRGLNLRGQAMRQGPGIGRRGPGGSGGRGPAFRGLDLTDAQKDQVKALREKMRAEIEAVLTPEQLEKLKARRGGRGGR